MSFCHVETKT